MRSVKMQKEEKPTFVANRKHQSCVGKSYSDCSDYVPHFDAIEILTLAAGVLFVVAVAFVL